jgi:ATP-dependent Lhr-like helicase
MESFPFHPVLEAWFRESFGKPTDIQEQAWRRIVTGENVLLAAPTGSGKTLAALMPCLNRIALEKSAMREQAFREPAPDRCSPAESSPGADGNTLTKGNSPPSGNTPLSGSTQRGVRLLYVTPLKALNNDIRDHLLGFLEELDRFGPSWPAIRVGVRTGDTPQSTRASMLRNPPDVLITTPESLYLLLTSAKARQMLASVEQVIVDEIHDLAQDKRGMHLSLTLERLAHFCGRPIQRIGLSATMKPLERVARFLGGWESAGGKPRSVSIVESGISKRFDVRVTMPETKLAASRDAGVWAALVDAVHQNLEGCRSTLIFVNNRRLCERLTVQLNDHAGCEIARAHHGSMSREKRLECERMLKDGSIRILVATSSLELGIDVGHVDRVIQIDSPGSAASGIQRIGRAGHSVGDVSRGVIIVRNRGQLAECAVLARDIVRREIEDIRIPEGTIDVLCQHITAMAAVDEWEIGELQALVGRSDSFRAFPQDKLMEALRLLSGFYPHVRPSLEWDRSRGTIRRLRHTPLTALAGAGTIPQGSAYPVYHIDSRMHLGELDEEYVHESRVGDVFQLGSASYVIRSIKGDRVYAAETENRLSEIPFWRGSGTGRSYELSAKTGALLREIGRRLELESEAETIHWLMGEYGLDSRAAGALAGLVRGQMDASSVPTDRKIVVERYTDDTGRHHVVIHSLFGRKLNRTWQLAIQRWAERRSPVRMYATVRDNGIEFVFPEWDAALADFWLGAHAGNLEELLAESLPSSPLFGVTFRHMAETALLLQRGFTRVPMWKQRLRSEQLLKDSLPYADRFPLIAEAMKLCLTVELDTERLKELLADLQEGRMQLEVKHTSYPSPFAAEFVWELVNVQMYESDAVSRDIQYQLISLSRHLAGQFFAPSAYRELADASEAQAWIDEAVPGSFPEADHGAGVGESDSDENGRSGQRAVRRDSAERLVRLLKTQGDLTEREIRNRIQHEAEAQEALQTLQTLLKRGAVRQTVIAGQTRWICADEAEIYASFPDSPESVSFILRRFAERQVALTAEMLAERYGISRETAEQWIARLAEEGRLEPSPFAASPEDRVWTSKAAASRLLRFSLGQIRRRSEPAKAERYAALIARLQHAAPETRLSGLDGLRQAVETLQGIFLPASHWETHIFPSRVTDYSKEWLDQLCAEGEVLWIGRKEEGEKEGRIAFFLAESKELYEPYLNIPGPSAEPEILELLRAKGASFLTALSRETGLVPSELTEKLLRLVWEGRAANDQFAPIRLHGTGKSARPASAKKRFQSGMGRWYALAPDSGRQPDARSEEKWMVARIHQMLKTFGVISKEMLADSYPVHPAVMQEAIRKLEDWGMVVRGFWVSGIPYMQISTVEMVEQLKQPFAERQNGTIVLSAADPANPYGVVLKWPDRASASFSRKSGNFLVFRNGRWLLWMENFGKRIVTVNPEAEMEKELPDIVLEAVKAMLRYAPMRKIVVESWNGTAAAQSSEAARVFRLIGAETERTALVLWPSSIKAR